ncbi:MAG: zinc ribbon domain-containing protein [Acidobacteria bacterium]|jgi:RNA polymerase subunit RPABC4/transcription elongation factor Spt4|nr:zinc ribbon domain-containing protein [Acidobacteriota bacterium]
MFFFIGGIQPRTVRLEKKERACPYCAHFEVYEKRTDHYLSVFFIPLIRVKKGISYVVCENCHAYVDSDKNVKASEENQCRSCGRLLDPGFSYCPYCGERTY